MTFRRVALFIVGLRPKLKNADYLDQERGIALRKLVLSGRSETSRTSDGKAAKTTDELSADYLTTDYLATDYRPTTDY